MKLRTNQLEEHKKSSAENHLEMVLKHFEATKIELEESRLREINLLNELRSTQKNCDWELALCMPDKTKPFFSAVSQT